MSVKINKDHKHTERKSAGRLNSKMVVDLFLLNNKIMSAVFFYYTFLYSHQ